MGSSKICKTDKFTGLLVLALVFCLAVSGAWAGDVADGTVIYKNGYGNYYGIEAQAGSATNETVTVGKNVTVTISSDSTGPGSDVPTAGLYAEGDTALITTDEGLKVRTSGAYSDGLLTTLGGAINVGDDAEITTYGYASKAAQVFGLGSLEFGDRATLATSGDLSSALQLSASSASIKTGNELKITTSGYYSAAVQVSDGTVGIGDRAEFTTTGNNGYGVINYSGLVSVKDDLIITTSGRMADGIRAL